MPLDKEACITILPKQLFRNVFTWLFHETFHMYTSWIGPLLCLAIALSFYIFSAHLNEPLVAVLAATFSLSLDFPVLWYFFMKHRTISRRKEDIAKNVASLAPGIDLEKWESVAYNLNWMLYEDRSWRTSHLFFSGEQCQSCFRDEVVRPVMQGKFNIESSEKDILGEAVESYQSALKNIFNEMQRDSLPELSQEFSVLPKYKHYTKLSFHKRYFVSVPFFSVLFYGCYLFLFMGPLIKFSYVMMLFCSFCFICVALANYKAYGVIRCAKLDLKSRVIFLATMVRIAPGVETDKWDQIAMHMNQYLHDAEVWKSYDEKFFDGAECLNFFKAEFQPLASGKLKLAYPELQNLVTEVVEICGLE
ncbi:uncharacterized protein ZBAI_08639 [Zygosaccharomyces bailii ISA1307]|nr:uncharacterized protein ZBAI_08639 [Zygosaccharomyces bailii ISA1307]